VREDDVLGFGVQNFGMGFSTEIAGGTTDTLFIAGGQTVGTMSKLARLDVSSFTRGSRRRHRRLARAHAPVMRSCGVLSRTRHERRPSTRRRLGKEPPQLRITGAG